LWHTFSVGLFGGFISAFAVAGAVSACSVFDVTFSPMADYRDLDVKIHLEGQESGI
jgi:hypothetical protein